MRYICPFCQDDTSSPALAIGEYGYKCFKCGAHGNLQKLREQDASFFDIKLQIKQDTPVLDAQIRSNILSLFLTSMPLASDTAFWDKKGITKATLDYFGVRERLLDTPLPSRDPIESVFDRYQIRASGLVKDNGTYFFPISTSVAFMPYRYNDMILSLKCRTLLSKEECAVAKVPRFANLPGAIPGPFGLQTLDAMLTDRIWLCEGESDVMATWQHNPLDGVIGVPGAQCFKSAWLTTYRLRDLIASSQIILAIDNDTAGMALKETIKAHINKAKQVDEFSLAAGEDMCDYWLKER